MNIEHIVLRALRDRFSYRILVCSYCNLAVLAALQGRRGGGGVKKRGGGSSGDEELVRNSCHLQCSIDNGGIGGNVGYCISKQILISAAQGIVGRWLLGDFPSLINASFIPHFLQCSTV